MIEGPLDLGYESITGEVSIKNSEFLHNIDLSNATAERAIDFSETTFRGNVSFFKATMKGPLCCEGAVFKKQANFVGAEFQETIRSGPAASRTVPTTFEKLANFQYCSVADVADFEGVTFHEAAVFAEAKIAAAHFVSARFKAEATFFGIDINGNADFGYIWKEEQGRGSVFEGECVFYGTHVGRSAL